MQKNQSGSAHAIIIGLLAVALVCALGLLFWQNIISKNEESGTSSDSVKKSVSAKESKKITKEYCAQIEKLCVNYPSEWTVDSTVKDGPNGKNTVDSVIFYSDDEAVLFLESGITGMGGMCIPEENSGKVHVIKVKQLSLQNPAQAKEDEWTRGINSPVLHAVAAYTDSNKTMAINITGRKNLTKEGESLEPCDATYTNLFDGKREYDSVVLGTSPFFPRDKAVENVNTFNTVSAAKAALSKEPYTTIFEVVASAHYK